MVNGKCLMVNLVDSIKVDSIRNSSIKKGAYQKSNRTYRVRFLRDVYDIRETMANYYVHHRKWVLNEFSAEQVLPALHSTETVSINLLCHE